MNKNDKDLNKDFEDDLFKSDDFLKEINEAIDMEQELASQERAVAEDLSRFEIRQEIRNEAKERANDDEPLPELDFSALDFEYRAEEDNRTDRDQLFDSIDLALAKQVDKSFEKFADDSYAAFDEDDEDINDEEEDEDDEENLSLWKSIPKALRVIVVMLISLILICVFFIFTKPGHAVVSRVATEIAFLGMNKVTQKDNERIDIADVDPDLVIIQNPETGATPLPTVEIIDVEFEEDNSVINVLLLGIENVYGESRGRSDSMMIVSIDKDGGPIKIVSLMRDMYVAIPGYDDNRINVAYSLGGPELLAETIEKNFKIHIDTYVMVNFEGFEAVIDALGGLEISLTAEEAQYLRTTNYISDKSQRNVVAGTQKMTGNQVLGYCRIRKVGTANGLYSDFGRTYRQRLVLEKLFDKYKSASYSELLGVMTTCLGYVTAPNELKSIAATCLQTVVEKKMFKIDSYRIPANGYYNDATINEMMVLIAHPTNARILHDYLYDYENFSLDNYK